MIHIIAPQAVYIVKNKHLLHTITIYLITYFLHFLKSVLRRLGVLSRKKGTLLILFRLKILEDLALCC